MSEFSAIAALMAFVITVVPLLLAGVIHAAVTTGTTPRRVSGGASTTAGRRDSAPGRGRPSASRGAHHGDRAAGAVDDRVADRAEQHSLVGASPARSHYH